ncbi:MAG: UvrB/UvrC motif-containing protein [Clostridia bacterium]|nr:UvrB/UvrC motif-containing protein [Clostridia bacterium]
MLCQHCQKNEANMHMKRIINGSATEVHLCSDCARSLGYGDSFSGFGLGFSDLFRDLLGKGERTLSGNALRCSLCGKSFDDIVESGRVGCAECYSTFYDKLLPTLRKIHGKTTHQGKVPSAFENSHKTQQSKVEKLKADLKKAVEKEDFETAAKLRDEINYIVNGGAAK